MPLPVRNIRLRGFSSNTLDNASGSSGEIFWDSENNTLRIFSGQGVGGTQLAKSNLANVSNAVFLNKAQQAGIGASSGEVEQGTQGNLAYYASTGTTIDEIAQINWINQRLSITGELTVTGKKNYLRAHWDSLAELQSEVSPTSFHGMIAHTHAEGRVYFAHNGNWEPLALLSDVPGQTNSFTSINVSGQGTVIADNSNDSLTLVAGSGITITTNASTDTITISGQATQNAFSSVSVAGQASVVADTTGDTLTLAAGTGITLTTDSTTDTVTINASTPVTSIDQLSDVDTTTTSPLVGQVLKWFGTSWRPATDATVGGAGTDADTLDGQDSTFYLNFNNLLNKPQVFKTISIAGQTDIVASQTDDTLTLVEGANVTLTTDSLTKTLTIASQDLITYDLNVQTTLTGAQIKLVDSNATEDIVELIGGSGVTLVGNSVNKTVTITSTAVTNSFTNIVVAGNDTVYATNSNETLVLQAGSNILLSTNNDTKTIVISASGGTGGGSSSNSFATLTVSGQNNIQADSSNDTLNLASGTGITITTDNLTDTITFTNSANTFNQMNVGGTVISSNSVSGMFSFFQGSGMTLTPDAGNRAMTITNNGVTSLTQGTGITVSASTGSVTISNSIVNISNLSDAGLAVYPAYSGGSVNTSTFGGVTVDKVFLHAMYRFPVAFVFDGTQGGSGYRIDSHYGNTLDPTIYLISGTTVAFNLNCAGYPFQVLAPGGTAQTVGMIHVTTTGTVTTGSNANNGKVSGTLYWQIPETATGNYTYRATNQPTTMTGNIQIRRISLI